MRPSHVESYLASAQSGYCGESRLVRQVLVHAAVYVSVCIRFVFLLLILG